MEGVKGNLTLAVTLSVPYCIQAMTGEMCPNDEISALINYMVTTLPHVTWESIASALYEANEEKVVERMKSCI